MCYDDIFFIFLKRNYSCAISHRTKIIKQKQGPKPLSNIFILNILKINSCWIIWKVNEAFRDTTRLK